MLVSMTIFLSLTHYFNKCEFFWFESISKRLQSYWGSFLTITSMSWSMWRLKFNHFFTKAIFLFWGRCFLTIQLYFITNSSWICLFDKYDHRNTTLVCCFFSSCFVYFLVYANRYFVSSCSRQTDSTFKTCLMSALLASKAMRQDVELRTYCFFNDYALHAQHWPDNC